jgi:N-acetylglucosamine malate deacetylase 1
MNIVVVGAHPDDPEACCGGLAAKAGRDGHRVTFLYGSGGRSKRKIDDRPEDEIRETEAQAACKMLGCQSYFLKFPMSNIPFNRDTLQRLCDFLRTVQADLILAHWPIDSHPDHQAMGVLATQAVVGNPDVALAYYEACTGTQTLAFDPNRFVDITSVAGLKKNAVECHVSQNVPAWWPMHEQMQKFRFMQFNRNSDPKGGQAEGYYLLVSTPQAEQLFSTRTGIQPSGSRAARDVRHQYIPLYLD